MCAQHLSCSVALPNTMGKSESEMVRSGETQLPFLATELFCDPRQKFWSQGAGKDHSSS